MKKSGFLLSLSIIILLFISAKPAKEHLFNGRNLDNWDKHIGTALNGHEELRKSATPEKVFSVVEKDGEKLIRISGEINGSLATQKAFGDYHLRLVFKWGDKIYTAQNSGLLYHSFGEFGVALGTWMAAIEHQLKHESVGDTYLMANTNCVTSAQKASDGRSFTFNPESEKFNFGEKGTARSIKKATDMEKPIGEWNIVDLYCFGQTSVHVVNGKVVMINTNCGIYDGDQIKPLTSGKIQIQSEGSELYIRSINIEPIKKLPKRLFKQ
jgi:hypothetical protein